MPVLASGRVAMVLAVLQRRCTVNVGMADVYASTVGGVRLTEPATDLAVALALAGGAQNSPLATGLIAIGEVQVVKLDAQVLAADTQAVGERVVPGTV